MAKKQKYTRIKVKIQGFEDLSLKDLGKLSYVPNYGQNYDFEQFLYKLSSLQVALLLLSFVGYKQNEILRLLNIKRKKYKITKKSLKKRDLLSK